MDGDAQHNSNTQLVEDDFKIRGAATPAQHNCKQIDVAPEACTICLQPITERAVAVPCNHLTFDFLCLVSWLQERAMCPLCNTAVTEVQYDWRGPADYKTYHVAKPAPAKVESQSSTSARGRLQLRDRRSVERWTVRTERALPSGEDPALERRRCVYRNRLYSLHVGANRISRYCDFSAQAFASSAEMQSRARAFLRRELQVFSFLDTPIAPRGGNRSYLVEYIVFVLKTNELKGASGQAEDLLADFLTRDNATQLLHELEAWLRSPYLRLEEWDVHVQYAHEGSEAKNSTS